MRDCLILLSLIEKKRLEEIKAKLAGCELTVKRAEISHKEGVKGIMKLHYGKAASMFWRLII